MNWLRLWHEMPTDPKWRTIARRSGQSISTVIAVYNFLLVNASANSDERGTLKNWTNEDVASSLDISEEDVAAVCREMQGRVLEGDKLAGWENRQPKREDDSSERVKKHRQQKPNPSNDPKRSVTQCNAQETDRNAPEEIQSREDKNTQGAREAPVCAPEPLKTPPGPTLVKPSLIAQDRFDDFWIPYCEITGKPFTERDREAALWEWGRLSFPDKLAAVKHIHIYAKEAKPSSPRLFKKAADYLESRLWSEVSLKAPPVVPRGLELEEIA